MSVYHIGDAGIAARLTVYENGVAKDISTATGITVSLLKPSGDVLTYPAAFYTNGADGVVQAFTGETDIDQVGVWSAWVTLTINGWTGSSDAVKFHVRAQGV